MSFLTVAQLVRACAPLDSSGHIDRDRLRLWNRRLRHWTALGILPTAAKHSEGAGQHRLYDSNLVYIAAVLLRVGAVGLPPPALMSISEMLLSLPQERTRFAQAWRNAIRHRRSEEIAYYLLIEIADEAKSVSLTISRSDTSLVNMEADAPLEPVIVLNLTEIFRAMRR